MPSGTIETFKKAALLNKEQKTRAGNIIHLPGSGRLIVSGDLHGNTGGYEQIIRYANLPSNPDTHILFQEIIHGGPQDFMGGCLSFKLLIKAAALKTQYPDNVHFVMANHDISTICDGDVLRGGREMTKPFHDAVERYYGDKAEMVLLSMKQFLFSQALAVKTQTGIFISHSLPADRFEKDFDASILDRPLTINDIVRPNSAYLFVWGRDQSPAMISRLAEKLGVKLFIVGHQKQDEGWKRVDPQMLILASDHNNGCIAEIDLAKEYDLNQLCKSVQPLIDLY